MDDLIQRAREALVDVTPGPWSHNTMGEFGPAYDDDDQAFGMICDPVGECDWPNAVDNARFIAAARDLVPEMADRIEKLEALLREAMEALHQYISDMRYPPERDSRDRRIAWAQATLAKLRAHLEDKA